MLDIDAASCKTLEEAKHLAEIVVAWLVEAYCSALLAARTTAGIAAALASAIPRIMEITFLSTWFSPFLILCYDTIVRQES
jgi:hypothetical protein